MKYNNLYEMVSINTADHPDRNAIFYYDTVYNYSQVQEKVDFIASVLSENGVRKGDKVGVLVGNSPEYIFTFFAIVKLGAVSVPQNYFLKAEEVVSNFNDCNVDYFIVSEIFADKAAEILAAVPSIKKTFAYADMPFETVNIYEQTAQPAAGGSAAEFEDLAMLIYTSGTTAKPKGVMLSHKNLLTNGLQYEILLKTTGDDYTVAVLPLFHAYAFLACVIGPFYTCGGTLIFNSMQDVAKADFARYIMQYKPTAMIGVPQLYSALARRKLSEAEQKAMPFRLYISGGAPLPQDTIDAFKDSYGYYIIEGYGLSEASPVAAFNPLEKPKTGSIGKIAPFMEYKLVDEDGNPVKQGEPGELVIKGDNVMSGYWGNPEETAKVLSSDGWLRTGDVATEDEENYLTIVDRIKDLIISKGMNIYPRSIEEFLYKLPEVAHAAVIGVPDTDGDEIVVAYIELHPDAELTETQVKSYLREHLANYKVPKTVVFTDSLPINASGKVMKKELKQWALKL